MHQIRCPEMVSLTLKLSTKHLCSSIAVAVFKGTILFYRCLSADIIKTESWWGTVVVIVHVSKYIGILIPCILQRSPQHFHPFWIQSGLLILVIYPSKEERVEAHPAEKGGRGRMVSKGVDMQSYVWNIIECFFEPPETHSHLINEILVVHVGLVRHTPASVDKL